METASNSQHLFKCGVAVVLIFATLVFSHYLKPYRVTGENLLVNSAFENNAAGWQLNKQDVSFPSDSPKAIQIHSTQNRTRVRISQRVSGIRPPMHLRLSADFRTDGVQIGSKRWHMAKLTAYHYNSVEQKKPTASHQVTAKFGTSDWDDVSRVFLVRATTTSIEVIFELHRAQGRASIRNINLQEVSPSKWYQPVRLVFLVLWGLFFLWLLFALINNYRLTRKEGLVLVAVVVMAALLVSGMLVTRNTNYAILDALTFDEMLNALPNSRISTEKLSIFNPFTWAHSVGFLCISLAALSLTQSVRTSLRTCLFVALFAVITETLQLLSEDRGATLVDLGLDFSGIFVAWCLWVVWFSLRRR